MKHIELDKELREAGKQLHPKVPDMIRRRQDEVYASLAEIPMQTKADRKHRSRKKIRRVVGAVAAAAFIGVMSSAYLSPAMAESLKRIPVIGSIFKLTNNLGLQTAEERGLVAMTDTRITHEGVTLSIPEVSYDGIRLSMAVKREGEGLAHGMMDHNESTSARGSIRDVNVLINGQTMNNESNGGRLALIGKPTLDPHAVLYELFDYSYLNGGKAAIPDQFQLTAKIALEGIAEPFIMEIPVRKNNELIVMPSGETREWGSLRLTLEEVTFTPITTVIRMNIERTDSAKSLNSDSLLYEIWDDQGRVLGMVGGMGVYEDNSQKHQRDELLFDRFADAPAHITLKAFLPEFEDPSANSGPYKLDENSEIIKTYVQDLEITVPVDRASLKKMYGQQ
ncbi:MULTISPECIES: DUF4179 domain-containing protein [Paenibacillus]|uniref:DUF4179 domain-containing protein n=1 Tax=Paenibacillus campinasensis TaxID=66347 RepID=A0ABW9T6T1_9BACL|nr:MULTISPECIES: DUF4179 domain-containing protein [Paenibacillus]MUG67820.1 DUF4179 domain-containing protein [Paenibacillus campinasensis]PAK48606.1 hypothetical protein CHH75_22500 [Paenibacillus sp. 7541]